MSGWLGGWNDEWINRWVGVWIVGWSDVWMFWMDGRVVLLNHGWLYGWIS